MIVTLSVAALDAQPALAVDVTKSATVAAHPATVWKTISAFRGIGYWQPAIEKCVLSEEAR